MLFRAKVLVFCLVLGACLFLQPALATACPTCKDGLNENHVSAFAFSIVFMMAVPYVLLGGFFVYIAFVWWRRSTSPEAEQVSADQLARLALEKAEQGIPTQPPAWDS